MKRLLFTASILSALMITIGVLAAQAGTEAKMSERATIQFNEPVKLLNVVLKGEYLFVHDEEKMAKGEDCTYVYNSSGKLIVSFHCIPAEREKADHFRVVTLRIANDLREMKEYQFAGSTEAHQVP
jgi:hypothetical protein